MKKLRGDKVIVRVPLALDAEVSDSFGTTEIVSPPTLVVAVDRAAYEHNPKPIMQEIYKRVDRIQRISREKGMSVVDLLKEKGFVQ